MNAVAVENVDKMVASGQHYASSQFTGKLPIVPGFDGGARCPAAGSPGSACLVRRKGRRHGAGTTSFSTSSGDGPPRSCSDAGSLLFESDADPAHPCGCASEGAHRDGGQPATSGVEIYGVAKGLSPEVMEEVYGQIVRWAQDRTLAFDLEKVPLSEIETAWRRADLRGRRLVVVP